MGALSVPAITKGRWRIESLRVSTLALWLGGFFVLGLTLRLVLVFYTDTIPLGGDPHWYYVVAINIARGFGFVASRNELFEIPGPGEPTAFWPPAYPIVLGGLWKVIGVSLTSAKVFNAVLGALAIPFVYDLGRRIFDRRVGLLAAGLFAVFPNAIAWTPLLFPEELFVLLFVAALWVILAFPIAERGRWVPVAAFGALVAVATLARGQGAALIPIALLYWLMRAGWRPALRSTAVALLAAAVVIAPWTIRNWVELDAFVPIATNSGAALRAGHAPDSTGTTKWTKDYINGFYMWQSLYRPDWEVQGYREYTRRAIEYAFTHPKHELELTGWKVYHLYRTDSSVIPWLTTLGATPIEPAGLEDALWYVFDSSYYALLFAAVLTVPFWFRRNADRLLPLNILLWWTVFHIVFLGEPRYHVPLYPLMSIAAVGGSLAALAAARAAFERWRSERAERAAAT